MELFYNCSLFKDKKFKVDKHFVVNQQEILLKNMLSNNNFLFEKIMVEYHCEWTQQNNWHSEKPTIIIPIKDNPELLTKTCNNLLSFDVDKLCNIIIVDDRSTQDIKTITINNNFSYLRVDNKKGFNFSMLNNIAALIAYKLGTNHIILWNSDLWCVQKNYIIEFIDKHLSNKSTISGSKLIYPPIEQSLNSQIDSDNIKLHFPNMLNGKWRNTVQFGGSMWIDTTNRSPLAFSPIHAYRFKNMDDNRVNCDKGETFVTGALQMIDIEWFIKIGGLNPSLSKNFQDVDLCLRAVEEKKKVFYFGKNIYFYHDESLSLNKEGKNDLQLQSDHVLFSKIWNNKIASLIF